MERGTQMDAAASFDPLRPRLIRVAYRMLGSVADADDVVQDAFLRWMGTDRTDIREPEALRSGAEPDDLNDDWKLGLVTRATAGQPLNRFSIHPTGVDTCKKPSLWADWCASQWYDQASFYDWDGKPAPRGSAGNLDWLYEVDLSLTYLTSVAGGDLTVKGTIYNLFNFDTPLRVYDVAQVINTDGSFAASPDSGVATRL